VRRVRKGVSRGSIVRGVGGVSVECVRVSVGDISFLWSLFVWLVGGGEEGEEEEGTRFKKL